MLIPIYKALIVLHIVLFSYDNVDLASIIYLAADMTSQQEWLYVSWN